MRRQQTMKKVFFIGIFLAVLGFSPLANAALQNNGNGLIYDTDLNITWYDYLNLGPHNNGLEWAEAIAWTSGLIAGGVTGWRLPTALNTDGSGPCFGFDCEQSEMGYLFYNELHYSAGGYGGGPLANQYPFTNLYKTAYWSSEEDTTSNAWTFVFQTGYQAPAVKGVALYALAVHDGNIGAPVPIPGAILLFAPGLAGIALLRRKFKR
jgi:hypothetical protein